MKPKDDIRLSWCKKHQQWWVMNCPDCMADSVEKDTIEALKARGVKISPVGPHLIVDTNRYSTGWLIFIPEDAE